VVKGQDIEQVAQIMTLRSMQQAKYSIENAGHFGFILHLQSDVIQI